MAVGIFYNKEQLNKTFKLVKWSPNVDYKVTNLVVYDNKIYKCITDHTSTDFTTDETSWELYVGNDSFTLKIWTSGENYLIDEYVVYDYKLYQANVDIIGDVNFDMTKYTLIIGCDNEAYEPWETNIEYVVGDKVDYNGVLYECIVDHTSTIFEDETLNWITLLEIYYSLSQEQYDSMVANGIIDSSNKHLYIISDAKDEEEIKFEMEFTDMLDIEVQHNLNCRYPLIRIFDTEDNEIELDCEYFSDNLTILHSEISFSGKVIVNKL